MKLCNANLFKGKNYEKDNHVQAHFPSIMIVGGFGSLGNSCKEISSVTTSHSKFTASWRARK